MQQTEQVNSGELKRLIHHKDITIGLWAIDRPLENLLTDFWQSSSDICPLEAREAEKQENLFREFVRKLQFQIEY